jgi:hypothetical protein
MIMAIIFQWTLNRPLFGQPDVSNNTIGCSDSDDQSDVPAPPFTTGSASLPEEDNDKKTAALPNTNQLSPGGTSTGIHPMV